jgi:hypothetical protein
LPVPLAADRRHEVVVLGHRHPGWSGVLVAFVIKTVRCLREENTLAILLSKKLIGV